MKISARPSVPGARHAASYPASHRLTIARSVICPMVPENEPGCQERHLAHASHHGPMELPGRGMRTSVPALVNRRAWGWMCDHPEMAMTLRFEIFPQDLDVIVDFYTRVLGFSVTKDQRSDRSTRTSH